VPESNTREACRPRGLCCCCCRD